MSEQKMHKIGNILALIVLIVCVLLAIGISSTAGINAVFWVFILMLFVFGPACFILYLREVKKGVFKDDSEE